MTEPLLSQQNEQQPKLRLLLLPGMDGTGQLFSDFLKSMPAWISSQVVRYPTCAPLSFSELVPIVQSKSPETEPFVILAESFSTPIAVQFAADPKANLRGIVICAGFIQPPIQGFPRYILSALAPLFCRLHLPATAIKNLLLGRGAPPDLQRNVRTAIASVSSKVLAHRLRAVLACDATVHAARIRVPVLYLQAVDDHLIGESALEAIKRAMPNVQLATIDGPHLILQREPQAALNAILPFLAGLSQGRSPASSGTTSS